MRFIHTKKRSRSALDVRTTGFKRRRVLRRKGIRRRANTITQTSRQLLGSNPFRFRGRKLRKSAYRRNLFNITRFKTHFRTVNAASDAVGTPNSVVAVAPFMTFALSNVLGTEFWHTNGGLQDPSFGEVPSWAAANEAADPLTIILRGGRLWLTTSLNVGTVDTCKIRVQLIFTKNQSRNFADGANSNTLGVPGTVDGYVGTAGINLYGPGFGAGTNRPIGWDISQAPDFEQYFYKPVLDRSYDLKAGDSMTTFWKVKPVKIDVGPFKDGAGYCPIWFVYVGQDNNSNAASETVTVVKGHNMSFAVGDTLT